MYNEKGSMMKKLIALGSLILVNTITLTMQRQLMCSSLTRSFCSSLPRLSTTTDEMALQHLVPYCKPAAPKALKQSPHVRALLLDSLALDEVSPNGELGSLEYHHRWLHNWDWDNTRNIFIAYGQMIPQEDIDAYNAKVAQFRETGNYNSIKNALAAYQSAANVNSVRKGDHLLNFMIGRERVAHEVVSFKQQLDAGSPEALKHLDLRKKMIRVLSNDRIIAMGGIAALLPLGHLADLSLCETLFYFSHIWGGLGLFTAVRTKRLNEEKQKLRNGCNPALLEGMNSILNQKDH